MGVPTSIRPSMLRLIQSALEMNSWGLPLLWNTITRGCSRKRSMMLMTWMLSLRPGTPGRSAHMPRMIIWMGTPAWPAA
ncbi:hypothetical protein D3C77_578370 [compost metagenome]